MNFTDPSEKYEIIEQALQASIGGGGIFCITCIVYCDSGEICQTQER